MQTQFNLTGLAPCLEGDLLSLELDSNSNERICAAPHHIRNITAAVDEASSELGLTESQSESIVNDILVSMQTLLLAKLLTTRRIF